MVEVQTSNNRTWNASVAIHFDAKSVSHEVQHAHLVINAVNFWEFIFSTHLLCLVIFRVHPDLMWLLRDNKQV
jgi:hypothetical protein